MKVTTKLKILRWVEKLLGLPDTRNVPPFKIEERKIQRIKSEYIISPAEKDFLDSKENLIIERTMQNIATGIAQKMIEIGAIKFEFDQDNEGRHKITATTYVPEKL